MILSLQEILSIIVLHWIFDFCLQIDKMALNKSKNNWWLTAHILVYSCCWMIIGCILQYPIMKIIDFTVITFVCHWITDYFTSRISGKLIPRKIQHHTDKDYYMTPNPSFHLFFINIGFDQILHYTQLFITYIYIFK